MIQYTLPQSQPITNFDRGNLVIRIHPNKAGDNNLRFHPLQLLDVKNNNIYLREYKQADNNFGNIDNVYTPAENMTILLLEEWFEGWAMFELPENVEIEGLKDIKNN